MTRNPVINALVAILYVAAVALVLYYGPRFTGKVDIVLVPITLLSMFVFSAAVIGFVFLYEPVQLFANGDRSRSIRLFLQTVAVFGGVTGLLLIALVLIARLGTS